MCAILYYVGSGVDTAILCGIETHVCVIATCRDLRRKGFNVRLLVETTV